MSFRALLRLRLRSVALQPAAGRALNPLKPTAAASATAPGSPAAPCYMLLLPRISYSSAYKNTSLVPAPRNNNFLVTTGHGSCFSAVETTTTEAAKKGEGMAAVAAGGGIRGRRGTPPASRRSVVLRSKAYRIYGEMYVCVYVLSWMVGRLIFVSCPGWSHAASQTCP